MLGTQSKKLQESKKKKKEAKQQIEVFIGYHNP
jgi:hypothetical protein